MIFQKENIDLYYIKYLWTIQKLYFLKISKSKSLCRYYVEKIPGLLWACVHRSTCACTCACGHTHASARHFFKFFVNMYDKMNLLIRKIFCFPTHLWSPLRPLHQIVAVLSFVAALPFEILNKFIYKLLFVIFAFKIFY